MARFDLTAPFVYSVPAQLLESFLDGNAGRIAPDLFEDLSALCEEIDKVGLNSETEINELKQEKEDLEKRIEELDSLVEGLENELEELKDGDN